MSRNRIRVVDDDNVTVHVSEVCADLVIQRRARAFAGTRALPTERRRRRSRAAGSSIHPVHARGS